MVLQMIHAFYERDRQECLWLEYELWLHVHANELESVIFGSTPRDELHRIFSEVFGLSPRACFNTFHQLVAMNNGTNPFNPKHLLWAYLEIKRHFDFGKSARFVEANDEDDFKTCAQQTVIQKVLAYFDMSLVSISQTRDVSSWLGMMGIFKVNKSLFYVHNPSD